MPEGPELLFWRLLFTKKIINSTINKIYSYTPKEVKLPTILQNATINNIGSKGKIVWLEIDDHYIHIHLGITGWFLILKTLEPPKTTKYVIEITKNNKTYYIYLDDQLRFSKINIYNKKQHINQLNKLGIDIFSNEFTLEKFRKKIQEKNKLLASFLLDQSIFSGIGNYIKNESIYLSKLNYKIKTSELSNDDIKELYINIRFVAYSTLYEFVKDYKLDKIIPKEIINLKPSKLHVPYSYYIYSLDHTSDTNQLVHKEKVAGRDSYYVKKYI